MSIDLIDIPRKLLPRWRSPSVTLRLGELDSVNKPSYEFSKRDYDLLRDKFVQMRENPSCGIAADLLTTAISMKNIEMADEAANVILSHKFEANAVLKKIARSVKLSLSGLTQNEETDQLRPIENYQTNLHDLRGRLKEEPRNSLLWIEVGRHHAILGNMESAVKAAQTAIHLQPNNRYLLRSFVRLLVHDGEPLQALRMLQNSPLLSYDPWIQASEIALSTLLEVSPKSLSKSSRTINLDGLPPHHAVELAGALCTLRYNDGKIKRAKKLVSKANSAPNENVAAQLSWLNRQERSEFLSEKIRPAQLAFEFNVWESISNSDFDKVIENCNKWYCDEPYSTRAPLVASYVAMIAKQDYQLGEKYCRDGLKVRPENRPLLNNLVVAQANQGKLNDAIKTYRTISWDEEGASTTATGMATAGLLFFRANEHDNGRAWYTEAIRCANRQNDLSSETSALLHLAKEEINIQSDEAVALIEKAKNLLKLQDNPILNAMLLHVEELNSSPFIPYKKGELIEDGAYAALRKIANE